MYSFREQLSVLRNHQDDTCTTQIQEWTSGSVSVVRVLAESWFLIIPRSLGRETFLFEGSRILLQQNGTSMTYIYTRFTIRLEWNIIGNPWTWPIQPNGFRRIF